MDIQLERELSPQEALELAYAEDDVDITAIYTEPPEINQLSDEDSGAEDDDGYINRLSRRQLRAAVEIQQWNNVRIHNFADSTPVEVFEMLWDDDIMKLIVDETRKYALFKNAPDPNITYEEIKCAVAILILSGYDVKPARRYCWDSKSDMGNQLQNAEESSEYEEFSLMSCTLYTLMSCTEHGSGIRIPPFIFRLQQSAEEFFSILGD
ncbi:hypothetical protein NQ318_011127 [Aromia moschata]|uniref:PiggyBac transposable element-derived protein domain-containing protein n=1 Tax=Aromia moschata TaxID=1265417 RepID=A0AAV8YR96_9CUCU|nr:hypothetical protein NQ318_011127 [Aromia moschata]